MATGKGSMKLQLKALFKKLDAIICRDVQQYIHA